MRYIRAFIIIGFVSFGFVSCKKVYTPKPRGYFRIDLPEQKYKLYEADCPYSFEIPEYATPELRTSPGENCWLNLHFPLFNATLHISYISLEDHDLGILLEDTYKLAYKHSQKADGIQNLSISLPEHNVYGIYYDIKGNVASSTQFFLTDSLHHYVRGALYFNEHPNKDSIAPVLSFINKDIDHLINTCTWKNTK